MPPGTAAADPGGVQDGPASLGQLEAELVAELYLSRGGMEFLTELVERFGSRFAGSEQERRAARWIAERWRAAGVPEVATEGFEVPGWVRGPASLEVVDPVQEQLACIALPYCPPGEVEGPLVFLGDGEPYGYEAMDDEIRGAVAMVTTAIPQFAGRPMHRVEKLGRAVAAGACGFIWMRGEPGGLPETGSARFGRAAEILAVSVSYEVGQRLVRLCRSGPVRVRLRAEPRLEPVQSFNVVGRLGAQGEGREAIVVGAHYDGHDVSEAATDNGAGVAVLSEVARVLAPRAGSLVRPVHLVAFAQEEMGLLGSEAYARAHGERADGVAFVLNLDGAGRGVKGTLVLQGWPEGVRVFRQMVEEMDEEIAVGDRMDLYSDMFPFAVRGIPAAWYYSTGPQPPAASAPRGFGHTFWDSLDKVSSRNLQLDAIRVARLVLRLSTCPSLPVRRKPPEEIYRYLRERSLDEVLRLEGRPLAAAGLDPERQES